MGRNAVVCGVGLCVCVSLFVGGLGGIGWLRQSRGTLKGVCVVAVGGSGMVLECVCGKRCFGLLLVG